MSTTLDLRGLTDAERDAQLNEDVACVHGWKDFRDQTVGPGVSRLGRWGINPETGRLGTVPPYATSADAVLPLLDKAQWWCISQNKIGFTCEVDIDSEKEKEGHATAATFALAACLALLRANGYEVLT